MKIRNIIWSSFIIFIFTAIMIIVIFIKEKDVHLSLEGRNANNFILPTVENVMNGEFQDYFELAYKDQFINREKLFKIYRKLDNALHYISSRNHTPYTLYQIGDNIYRFDGASNYLLEFPIIRNSFKEEDIITSANNINDLANKYEDINFYVYDGFRLNMVDWFDKDNFITSYGIYNRDLFHNSLNSNIQYYSYYPSDLDEYTKYFFKTDPHWNTHGSYEFGYKKIVDMINNNYHNLEYLEPIDEHIYNGYSYYGQYGRGSLYSTTPDIFSDLKFHLPEYKTVVNGVEQKYDHVDEYENGTIESYMMPYIYSNLHGNDEKEVEFDFNTNNGRVLLAFVDSYASPIKYLIASHFDKAIFIDLRIYTDFDIDEYVNKYGVTDILYLEYYGTLYNPSYIINID